MYGAAFYKVGNRTMGPRGRGRELERSGVGHDPCIKIGGNLWGNERFMPQLVDKMVHHLASTAHAGVAVGDQSIIIGLLMVVDHHKGLGLQFE